MDTLDTYINLVHGCIGHLHNDFEVSLKKGSISMENKEENGKKITKMLPFAPNTFTKNRELLRNEGVFGRAKSRRLQDVIV